MTSRSLHKTRERCELTVLWSLIAAFLLAWALMFVHPTGAIAVFWLGLLVVLGATVVDRVLVRAEERAERREIEHRRCPRCDGALVAGGDADGWVCSGCQATYLEPGTAPSAERRVEPRH